MGVRRVSSVPHLLQWKVSNIKKIGLSVSIEDGQGVNIDCSWPALQPPLLLKPIRTFLESVWKGQRIKTCPETLWLDGSDRAEFRLKQIHKYCRLLSQIQGIFAKEKCTGKCVLEGWKEERKEVPSWKQLPTSLTLTPKLCSKHPLWDGELFPTPWHIQ